MLSTQVTDPDVVLAYTHCEPPEDYFITSQDMVGKAGVWAHFGIWNFERAREYNHFKSLDHAGFSKTIMEEFGYTKSDAERLYFDLQSKQSESERAINDWIAPWPGYFGTTGCSKNNEMLQCSFQIQTNVFPFFINLTTMDAMIPAQDRTVYPDSFGYVSGDEYVVKNYDKDTLGFSIALLESDGSYSLLGMDNNLVGSMFTKLFFFDGVGTEHFDKFSDVQDITGQRIIVWKVDWDKKE